MRRKYLYYFFFFFFQAEDGIRDLTVTGVQTCALPIWRILGILLTNRLGKTPVSKQYGAGIRTQEDLRIGSRRHADPFARSEEHTSELQSQSNLVCRLLLEKKKKNKTT